MKEELGHMFWTSWEILGEKRGECVEQFACETQVISGEGALEALSGLTGKRLLVVRDSLENSKGIGQRIRGMLKPEAEAFFDNITPEPTMTQAVDGVKLIKKFCPDLVVAVGGSHVVDCAKAMVCFSGRHCQLAVVPTAVDSGAVVTGTVTLTHEKRRHTFQNPGLHPHIAVLDKALLTDCPAGKIAEGGFQILAACLQAYLGKDAGMLTGFHAREGFTVCWGALPAAFAGNAVARGRLQMSAILAGMASDHGGLGLCQAMVDSLGSQFHLSPGSLAGILLPAVIGCNAHAAGRKLAELSRAAGLGGSSETVGVRNLKGSILRLRRELGMPATLTQAGINPKWVWSNLGKIVEQTLEDPRCKNNPVMVDDFLVRRILEETTGHI